MHALLVPFSPVQSARKFSQALGASASKRSTSRRPARSGAGSSTLAGPFAADQLGSAS